MNHISIYTKILKIRTIFKRIQQLSWTINKMEQKYNVDNMESKDQSILLNAYLEFIDELENILDELKNEQKQINK